MLSYDAHICHLNAQRSLNSIFLKKLLTAIMCFILFFEMIPGNINAQKQQLAQDKSRFLGAGTSALYWRDFFTYWNQLSPGNDGKWGSVENVRGTYNFTNLDNLYSYANSTGMLFKEHCLVWGQQQPSWIASLDTASQRAAVENWIKAVGQRYPKIALVDVVNEPFHAVPSYKNALGGDGVTGWDWVIYVFKLARIYFPSTAKLILNDYSILQDYTITSNYINLINLLKDRGLIDGVGIQGHYFEFRSHVNATSGNYINSPSTLRSNLDRIAAIGLPIYATEFDIDEANDANQLAQYQSYFPVFWTSPAVKGITFWGYIQNDVWTSYPNTFLLYSDGTERPAMQWLRTYVSVPIPPVIMSPNMSDTVQLNPVLKWHSSNLATSYRIQVSSLRSFSSVVKDTTIADTVIQLSPLAANTTYYWHVSAINSNGTSDYATLISFITNNKTVAIEQRNNLPSEYKLMQNYPNPFNPSTIISYQVPVSGFVSLKVYDQLGREVTTLVNEFQNAGAYNSQFSTLPTGRQVLHSQFGSGIYFYTLRSGNFMQTKKMILLK